MDSTIQHLDSTLYIDFSARKTFVFACMKNVKGPLQFWCLDGFNCADYCSVTDLTVQMDLTIPDVIMIGLNSRFVYASWLSNLIRIFSTISTNFHHLEKYHEIFQVKC